MFLLEKVFVWIQQRECAIIHTNSMVFWLRLLHQDYCSTGKGNRWNRVERLRPENSVTRFCSFYYLNEPIGIELEQDLTVFVSTELLKCCDS